jgi:Fructose-bisphosphate aldolase class-I
VGSGKAATGHRCRRLTITFHETYDDRIRRTRRMSQDLESIAARPVADGKGILAADESIATLTRRLTRSGSSQPKPDPMVTS